MTWKDLRLGRDDYFWSHIADATDLTRLILSASEEEAVWDAVTMQETIGHDVWRRAISLDLVEVYTNRGTAWTAWGFSTGGEWIVASIRWTEKALAPVRELLALIGGDEDTRDWVKVRKGFSTETEKFLRGHSGGEALVAVSHIREFDGKGKGWNGWEFTERGEELVTLAS